MNAKIGRVETGRVYPRSRTYECHSCQQRNAIGEPKASESWAAKMHAAGITEEQMDLLLLAAAEYRELCAEVGEPAEAVDFLDWVRPDALGLVGNLKVEPPVLPLREYRERQGVA